MAGLHASVFARRGLAGSGAMSSSTRHLLYGGDNLTAKHGFIRGRPLK
jgi:hypothetical protein